jgi:hypothetical protein
MTTVRLDVTTAEEESEPRSAYQQLEPFVGLVDSGRRQLSTATGNQLQEILKERQRARRPG